MASGWNDQRPMSPHLQIWKWHPAMLSSILHRVCAVISYIALIKIAFFMLALAFFDAVPLSGLIFSPLGAIGVFIGVFALTFMALAQLRHNIWDMGKMLDPDRNNSLSYLMIALAFLVAVVATYAAVRNF